nr:TolC family outer membrane protein [Candidatus Magnetococcus massalia]CRH08258.1 Type I secretion outer membrane protein, TolC family [Candidatus Magnetococcus massalia]
MAGLLKPARWAMLGAALSLTTLGSVAVATEVHPFTQAVAYALQHNPAMAEKQADLGAAEEKPSSTAAALRPDISFTGKVAHTGLFYHDTTTRTDPHTLQVDLTQSVYNRSLWVADEQAEPYVNAAVHDVADTMQATILDVAKVYLGVLEAQEVEALSAENLKVTKRHLEATQARFEVGETTRTDVRQAEARVAEAVAELQTSKNSTRVAHAQYREKIRLDAPENMPLPELTDSYMDQPLNILVDMAEAERPDMRAARDRLKITELDVKSAKAGHWPTLTFLANGTFTDNSETGGLTQDTRYYSFTLQAAVPIYEGGGTESGIREAKHELSSSRADMDSKYLQIKREVEEALLSYHSAVAVVKSYESALAAAKDALDGVEQEFQVGTRTALDLLDQQKEVFRNETELTKRRYSVVEARFTLLEAIGKLTPAELGM